MPDFAQLSSPLSQACPCGEDLSLSVEFDQIAEARRADDPSLPQGEWITELKCADWVRVEGLCSQLLAHESRDMRLCLWLTEAWAHRYGFAGLADGYELLTRLCASDWQNLHPQAEDEDQDARIATLEKLLKMSLELLRIQPLTDAGEQNYCLDDLEQARRAARVAVDDDSWQTATAGSERLQTIQAAQRATPAEFYAARTQEMQVFMKASDRLEEQLQTCLGARAPSFDALREQTDTLLTLYSQRVGKAASSGQSKEFDSPVEPAPFPSADADMDGGIVSREQALEQLRQVGAYFRRTEPHSPVAYLADTAANWGSMPLHIWLETVMHDHGELAHMQELLGLAALSRGQTGPEAD